MDRTTTIEELLSDDVTLFSLPRICLRLSEVIEDPASTVSDIAEVISEDQALSAKILKLANSPFYGYSSKVETVSQAVTVTGTQQVYDLVLAVSLIESFDRIPAQLTTMELFWQHSIGCGLIARIIATFKREPNAERYFVSGLLHDLGRAVMFARMPKLWHEISKITSERPEPLFVIEREIAGFDHADVGGLLLSRWALPQSIVHAVDCHHDPGKATELMLEAAITHVADIVAHAFGFGQSGEPLVPPLLPAAWDRTGLSASILSLVMSQADLQFQQCAQILKAGSAK